MASDLKDVVHEVMELNSAELAELSCFLWSHPELALQETKAHELLTAFLERRGFTVERRYLLDTAFRAEFQAPGGSDGPCIALMCEYDALPDIGHGCGHNLIAEASIGAALAVKEAMTKYKNVRGVITEGGKYPNIIPEATEMRFFVRSPSTEELIEALGKVEACFRGAAEATGCTVTIETMGTYMHVIHNATIAKTYRKHAHSLGVSFVDDFVQNMPPSGASTDCGNVSHRIPTVHPMFGLGDTAAARGPMNHTREFTDWAGAAESQAPTLRAAKIMALTVLDLFTDPEILRQAKEEFSALSIPPEEELRTLVS
ncbi:hypothetical protein HPB48_002822 [Haemaphysalis longicornis]|uniref:Peptidase M20 domain-containing protein 2 n=1 Tax=Haemaphysalis longicornis TaxID=44386 RepID=A0A9J6GM36_HAELO|nr:hypothetical protein HPB48_002822 [Haemaphysalis longicornis]